MTTERLYEFIVLSRTLNYTSASRHLYITQPTLSKHIQELENELGIKLFERSSHGIALTASGTLLAQESMSLIEQCNHAVNLLQLRNLSTRGTVRVAMSCELAYATHMKAFIRRFTEQYRDIDVRTDVKCDGMYPELLSEHDFVFTPCEFQRLSEGTEMKLVKSHGIYVVIYPGHPLLSKSLLTLSKLQGETLIVPFEDEPFGPYARNLMLAAKYTHDNINHLSAPNLSTALFMVTAGKGIALVPRYVRSMIPADIFMIGISNADARFNEYLYYNKNNISENGAAGLFLEEFRTEMNI